MRKIHFWISIVLPVFCVSAANAADVDSYEYQIPAWLDRERVQFQLPFARASFINDRDRFWNVASELDDLDIRAYTRHSKAMNDGPMWPTHIINGKNAFGFGNPPLNRAYYASFIRDLPTITCTNPGENNEADDYDPLFTAWLATAPLQTNCRDTVVRANLRAQEEGVRMISYYWLGADEPMRLNSTFGPEYVALEPVPTNGNLQTSCEAFTPAQIAGLPMQCVDVQQLSDSSPQLAYRMSLETEYRNAVIQRMKEIAARDVPAVYLDQFHGAQKGDWRFYLDNPSEPAPPSKDMSDPDYRNLLVRFNDNNTALVQDILTAGQTVNSDFTVIMAVTFVPSLFEIRSRSSFAEQVPVAKSEFHLPIRQVEVFHRRHFDDRTLPASSDIMEFGHTLLRDAAYGRPTHIWIHNPTRHLEQERNEWSSASVLSSQHLSSATAFVLGLGSIANLAPPIVSESRIDDPRWLDAIALKSAGRNMKGYRPYQWLAVHFSEEVRDAIYDSVQNASDWEDVAYRRAWDELIYPTMRSYLTFKKRGMPVNLITDGQIMKEEFGDYRYIVVPSSDISQAMKNKLSASGKTIIYLDDPPHPNPIVTNGFKEGDLLARADFLNETPFKADVSSVQRVSYYTNAQGKVIVNIYKNIDWLLTTCGTDQTCISAKLNHPVFPSSQAVRVNQSDYPTLSFAVKTGNPVTQISTGGFWKLDVQFIADIAQFVIN